MTYIVNYEYVVGFKISSTHRKIIVEIMNVKNNLYINYKGLIKSS